MKVTHLVNKRTRMNGVFVDLSREEALRLAISLMGQVRTNNPNTEREEFYPQGKFNYFTISVKPEPNPPNFYKILHEIEGEIWEAIPEGETPHKRGVRKGIDRVWRILYSKLIAGF